jgi:hypothetical protein
MSHPKAKIEHINLTQDRQKNNEQQQFILLPEKRGFSKF